jgi:GDPmannose 4,6-dehydratase
MVPSVWERRNDVARALITGVTGQIGSILADLLLDKGYEVHGLLRPSATVRTHNIQHLIEPKMRIKLHYADITDFGRVVDVIKDVQPDEVYNMAAQAHVKISFDMPIFTAQATGIGALSVVEAVRVAGAKGSRVYQASSSEMFGSSPPPQNETTPFHPRSPYAAAKAFAYHIAVNYREAYGMHLCNGILFNSESERRGQHYVTRKVTLSAARIAAGLQHELRLGNLDARRDWGCAYEAADGIWRILQAPTPDDYVLATGKMHTVRELVEIAFGFFELDWKQYVKLDAAFLRPTEVDALCGDSSKAQRLLDWKSETAFEDLIVRMAGEDEKLVGHELVRLGNRR